MKGFMRASLISTTYLPGILDQRIRPDLYRVVFGASRGLFGTLCNCHAPSIFVGAYVGEGSMVDSHTLVGSCAQVGQGVHLSAVQLGGVLEPIGMNPVIIEDECFTESWSIS